MILSAVATDVASIVLMDGTLRQMLPLVKLMAEFDRNLDQGSVVAIAPGVFCLGGIFFLHFGLPMAIAIRNANLLGSVGIAMAPLLRRRGREGLPSEIPAGSRRDRRPRGARGGLARAVASDARRRGRPALNRA